MKRNSVPVKKSHCRFCGYPTLAGRVCHNCRDLHRAQGITVGDKVRTTLGSIETVRKITEHAVYTYENLTGWYHPTHVEKI